MSYKAKILIIDDEESVTSVLRALVESTGLYEVDTANSGKAGFEKARAFRPDLILLDVMMPDFGGDLFASKAKKEPVLQNTTIVFLTGIVTKDEVKNSGGRIGGYAYLAKPITSAEELTMFIATHLPARGA